MLISFIIAKIFIFDLSIAIYECSKNKNTIIFRDIKKEMEDNFNISYCIHDIYMIFTGIVQYYPRLNLADYFPNIPYIRISNIGIEIALSNHIYMLIFFGMP